jgi:taurine dioxygenase
MSASFEIRDLPEILGAEILNLDLAQPLDDDDFARIRRSLADRAVLVFRDQEKLTPEQQIAMCSIISIWRATRKF